MRSSGTGKTLSGSELRELQAVLRKRASNIRKKGKRQGLLRPLSKDHIGKALPHAQAARLALPAVYMTVLSCAVQILTRQYLESQ